jgi:hypothetical protein
MGYAFESRRRNTPRPCHRINFACHFDRLPGIEKSIISRPGLVRTFAREGRQERFWPDDSVSATRLLQALLGTTDSSIY